MNLWILLKNLRKSNDFWIFLEKQLKKENPEQKKNKIQFFETSAKQGVHVEDPFESIVEQLAEGFVFEKKDLVVFLTKREHLEKVENLFRISSLI